MNLFAKSAGRSWLPLRIAWATLLLLTWLPASVSAGSQKASTPPAAVTPARSAALEMNASDLETFLDGLVPVQIARDDIAGVVICVVKDGKILFAKGYGFADVEKKKPVSPGDTLFRPGSTSKLFIWTAVMQLVEQGKLELDRAVNEYLDFKIPATFPQPITLRHIMTHTPGFEESGKDLFVPAGTSLQPLGAYLSSHLPRRLFPPGTIPAYSNYGTSLAGYIIQRVSGMPLEDYLDQFIFKPLGMERSTFRQPLPKELQPFMSIGYQRGSEAAKSFEVVQGWPAGSLTTSAEDISKFMLAHLQRGQFNGASILRPETAGLMHSRQFGLHDALPGMALGFYEETSHGQRIIGHGGDTAYFHSDLHLVLDAGVGFFISYNSAGRGEVSGRSELWEKILDRYFPYSPPEAPAVATAAADAATVSGTYMVSRRSDASLLRLAALIGQASVVAKPDGTIEIDLLKETNGKPKRWLEVGPLLYREVGGQGQIAFRRDAEGRLQLILHFPFLILQRASLSESKRFILAVIGGSLGVLLLTVVLWPMGAMVRKHYGRKLDLSTPDRRLRLAVRLVCLLNLVVVAAWAGTVAYGIREIGNFNSGLDPVFYALQSISLVSVIGTVFPLFNLYRTWSDRQRWWGSKLHDTAIALACIAFSWLLLKSNFLSFSVLY